MTKSSYKPFLIADFDTGLVLDKEPWLLPQDAFESLKSCYLRDGVLEKRKGHTEFSDTSSGDAIVGIHNFIETDGSRSLIANTINRTFEYNPATGNLDDKDGADNWTGTVVNLTSAVNFQGKLYMANGKDQLRSYNGTAAADEDVDLDGDTNNDLDFCLHVAVQKERLILFHTSENGVRYPQRVRWSVAGSFDFTNDEAIDAPTSEWLIAVEPVNDDFICFFEESIWLFRYTGDPILPFRFEQISPNEGAAANFGSFSTKDSAFVIDKIGVVFSDGVGSDRIKTKVPNFSLNISQESIGVSFGVRFDELDQAWFMYPSANASANDSVLALNTKNFSFAVLEDMPFTCAGFYTQDDAKTWATFGGTWAEAAEAWVSNQVQAGFPFVLGGKSDGKIYQLNDGGNDDSATISMEAITGRWNPFKEIGLQAWLGYVDFLVTVEPGTELSVDFFINFDDVAYRSEIIEFEGAGDKVWFRVDAGAQASSHRLRLYQNKAGQFPKVHAIMPYFKPSGLING
jgi:hypothetical protein